MSSTVSVTQSSSQQPALLLAEFDSAADLLHAAEQTRDAGFKHFDVHTPFPVHGMDEAMGLSDSKVGWMALILGLCGTSGAFLMIWWMNAVDYPIIIGGKPPFSLPSMIPVMFELTILLASFGAIFGMFHLNKLPRHHHPVFYSDRFSAFSDHKFFLSIEATDPKFDAVKTHEWLQNLHPTATELVEHEVS